MATIIENDLGLTAEDFTPEDMAFFQDYMNKQRDIMSSSPTTVSPEEDMLTERYFQVMDAALARKEAKAASGSTNVQQAAKALAAQKAIGGPDPLGLAVDNQASTGLDEFGGDPLGLAVDDQASTGIDEFGSPDPRFLLDEMVIGNPNAGEYFMPHQSPVSKDSTMRGIIATDRERIQQGQAQIEELNRRAAQAQRGTPVAGAPGFRMKSLKDERDLEGYRGDISRMKGMLESEMSGMSYADLDGQTLPPEFPDLPSGDAPQRGTMSTPEDQRNDLMSQYNMHEEAMSKIPRTLLGQISPRNQAEFSHHKRESDRALALLEGIDKGAAPESIEGMTVDEIQRMRGRRKVDETDYRQPEDFNVVGDAELGDTGMIPKEDYYPFGMMDDNFGKPYQPDVSTKGRGFGKKTSGQPVATSGRKSAAVDDPLDYVSPTGDADFAAIDASLGRREAPVRQSTRAADNILESMLAEQNQAKEYMQLMPSIDMLRRQISGMGNRDQALGNLESRIKSAKSASDLFSLDADVRNVGGDVARSRDSFVDALGTGSQTAQKMFELEASKPASRKKLATEMFDAMQAPELVSYGDDFRDYLSERPEVRVQYSKALSKQAEKLRLAASKDSDNAMEYNKALLEIKKTQAEIKKLEAERKKIQAATKKTLSSAKSKGKGASRAQQTAILKEIYARQEKAPRAKLKAIEERLKNLGRQGLFDPKQTKEIDDLRKEAAVYRNQLRKIGADYLRVEQVLAKGDSWSEAIDSISK